MLRHAIESFEHGLEHFLDGTERSRKFALLHIDQGIELFLKEKAVQLGKSIYKSDGTTLNLHETFSSLKQLTLPEQPRIEELHDLRNAIQHKGLTPDEGSTQFYVQVPYAFVQRFLRDELATAIETILPHQYRALMEGQAIESTVVVSTDDIEKTSPSPGERIILGYTTLVRAIESLGQPDPKTGRIRLRKTLLDTAEQNGFDRKKMDELLTAVFAARGKVLHSDQQATEKEAQNVLKAVRKILTVIGYGDRIPGLSA